MIEHVEINFTYIERLQYFSINVDEVCVKVKVAPGMLSTFA